MQLMTDKALKDLRNNYVRAYKMHQKYGQKAYNNLLSAHFNSSFR